MEEQMFEPRVPQDKRPFVATYGSVPCCCSPAAFKFLLLKVPLSLSQYFYFITKLRLIWVMWSIFSLNVMKGKRGKFRFLRFDLNFDHIWSSSKSQRQEGGCRRGREPIPGTLAMFKQVHYRHLTPSSHCYSSKLLSIALIWEIQRRGLG